jgi:hypothetical protein
LVYGRNGFPIPENSIHTNETGICDMDRWATSAIANAMEVGTSNRENAPTITTSFTPNPAEAEGKVIP